MWIIRDRAVFAMRQLTGNIRLAEPQEASTKKVKLAISGSISIVMEYTP